MKINSRLFMIAAVAGLLASASAGAADRPLPDFAVTASDAATVSSAELGDGNHWLLIYMRPDCAPCDEVAYLWTEGDAPAPPSRVRVIVGAASPATLARVQASYPMLNGATWYADANGTILFTGTFSDLTHRPTQTVKVQASLTGRNTSYGYPANVCQQTPAG